MNEALGGASLKNDATEKLHTESSKTIETAVTSDNYTLNQAKHGGRFLPEATDPTDPSELACRELHSMEYITEGQCRSMKMVKELVCAGQCIPFHLLPNSIGRGKWWHQSSREYRCVPAHSHMQRIQLLCPDNEVRTYKRRIVTSCRCKRYSRFHNQSVLKDFGKRKVKNAKKKKSQAARIRHKPNHHELENAY
ncbi:sclerostin [Hyperolius riggenbachi]|uniref:sclerostin n=1 Tax=Hyperolius riggenbachi TaxID=752182 RepID=UPI0035A31F0A